MWQPIETAPEGKFRTDRVTLTTGKVVEKSSFVPEFVLTASKCGKVILTHRLENGRWQGYSKEEAPLAWMPLPMHPEAQNGTP